MFTFRFAFSSVISVSRFGDVATHSPNQLGIPFSHQNCFQVLDLVTLYRRQSSYVLSSTLINRRFIPISSKHSFAREVGSAKETMLNGVKKEVDLTIDLSHVKISAVREHGLVGGSWSTFRATLVQIMP